ncbi:MAG: matrixin family metalloprotease [Acidobacteria bacterium]|nr:matrixin family metalloprotease [Acidobacteriota bacterium]
MLLAQPGVDLKTDSGRAADRASSIQKRRTAGQWHMLLVFPQPPGRGEVEVLEARGIHVVQFVPERGLMASVPETAPLEDLPLEWVGRLRPEQKVSPALVDAGLLGFGPAELSILVEFYSDVARADAYAIAVEEQLTVLDSPDLLAWQLALRGPASRLAKLAEWDEVAYLFPASLEVTTGQPVEACAGAYTTAGRVGQIVAKVGEGWDGPGKGSADIGYVFSSFTGRLSAGEIRTEISRALEQWSRFAKIRFTLSPSALALRTINFLFTTGDHGDGYSFDGRGRTLAHTFYPSPPNPEPIAGDVHFDDDEPWQIGAGIDLFSVALHEIGHALGLGHSDSPTAVMYPYYRHVYALNNDDIAAIRELYAAQDSSTTPTPAPPPAPGLEIAIEQPAAATASAQISLAGVTTGGAGSGQVNWTNGRGASGVARGWRSWSIDAIPVDIGDNLITITAVDSANARASKQVRITRQAAPPPTPLSIRILSPIPAGSYASSASSISLSGTAGPEGRLSRIWWSSSRGSGGSINGTPNWITSAISLEPGLNRITVTATDVQGSAADASLDVIYSPPSPPSPPAMPDTVAPALTILYPPLSIYNTSSPAITITGSASDNVAVTEVNWLGSSSRSGKAIGTTNWLIPDFPLLPGINTIMIRAHDAAGNFSWRALSITRN